VAGWAWLAEGGGEQPLYFVDGERDQAGVTGRRIAWPGGRRCLGAGAVPELGGGDGADSEGGHDEHEVAADRGVEPRLALVQAEAVLAELESSFTGHPSPAAWISRALVSSSPSGTQQ
jgi:hypothetical protein